jgi:NADP-dependent 3-hydroxy acid dehydrogenase YdfG
MSDDRYVLITGASGGLGRALVRRLEQEGRWLALAGREEGRLREAHPDSDHPLVVGDTSTADGAASLLQQCRQHCGQPPDALAHCVDSIMVAPLHRTTPEQSRGCISANLDSDFHTLSAWINALRATKRPGAAVFVSTAAARIGTPNHEAVATAKAGLEGLAGRRRDLRQCRNPHQRGRPRPDGHPGSSRSHQQPARPRGRRETVSAARHWRSLATGRPDGQAIVTGQIWSMDGGFSAIRSLVR